MQKLSAYYTQSDRVRLLSASVMKLASGKGKKKSIDGIKVRNMIGAWLLCNGNGSR